MTDRCYIERAFRGASDRRRSRQEIGSLRPLGPIHAQNPLPDPPVGRLARRRREHLRGIGIEIPDTIKVARGLSCFFGICSGPVTHAVSNRKDPSAKNKTINWLSTILRFFFISTPNHIPICKLQSCGVFRTGSLPYFWRPCLTLIAGRPPVLLHLQGQACHYKILIPLVNMASGVGRLYPTSPPP